MRSLLTPRWLLVHAAVVVLVTGFLLLCWWQVTRAASGNLLSFGYAVEWPVFAGFVIFVWVREMRRVLRSGVDGDAGAVPDEAVPDEAGQAQGVPAEDLRERGGRPTQTGSPRHESNRRRSRNEAAYDDSDDPELAAYNDYLAWRNAHPHATAADYPGMMSEPERERPGHQLKESR